uniref:hypothetical protein n=1 Tax=Gelidibacter sp. TaxID=2018083 RepID=UPI00404B1481
MSLFKQQKNKRFSYTPRHREEQDANDSQRFDPKWLENRKHQRKSSTMPWLLIGLGMVIVLWYVLNNYQN